MPAIPYTTRNLPPLGTTTGTEDVSASELAWAAVTVGTNPLAMPFLGRPFLELLWRVTTVSSSLAPGPAGWMRTRSFDRMDPSEKTAISYFLGNVHAKVMTNRLLGVAHLVHHDAYPGALHRRSRPDFLGMDAQLGLNGVAVEAKGRSGPLRSSVVATALKQAGAIRAIAGVNLTRPMATVAYHSSTGQWRSHLEGPPPRRARRSGRLIRVISTPTGPVTTVPHVLGHYYAPLIAALVPVGMAPTLDDPWLQVVLPAVDCAVWLPSFVITAFQDIPSNEDGIELAGLRIAAGLIQLGYLTGRTDLLERVITADDQLWFGRLADQAPQLAQPSATAGVFQGDDIIRVEVGDSWLDRGDTTQ